LAPLTTPDDDVRKEIVFAISEIRTDEKPVINALQQALKDLSPVVREAAQETIDKLQSDDDDNKKATTKKAPSPKP